MVEKAKEDRRCNIVRKAGNHVDSWLWECRGKIESEKISAYNVHPPLAGESRTQPISQDRINFNEIQPTSKFSELVGKYSQAWTNLEDRFFRTNPSCRNHPVDDSGVNKEVLTELFVRPHSEFAESKARLL
jgi:hypothetical protein